MVWLILVHSLPNKPFFLKKRVSFQFEYCKSISMRKTSYHLILRWAKQQHWWSHTFSVVHNSSQNPSTRRPSRFSTNGEPRRSFIELIISSLALVMRPQLVDSNFCMTEDILFGFCFTMKPNGSNLRALLQLTRMTKKAAASASCISLKSWHAVARLLVLADAAENWDICDGGEKWWCGITNYTHTNVGIFCIGGYARLFRQTLDLVRGQDSIA